MAEHPLTSDASRPWSVYAATGRYKKATKQLSRFINENGGDTSKIAGWEWAPHDVLDFTGGVIPADVWMALKEAIAEREYVAHHYDNIRIRDGGDYTNADIGHLRFVELLKIIRTVWSTYVDDEVSCVDEPEGVTNLDMLSVQYLDDEDLARVAADVGPGVRTINRVPLIDTSLSKCFGEFRYHVVDGVCWIMRRYVSTYPQSRPIIWECPNGLPDFKFELRRYLDNGWEFVLKIIGALDAQVYQWHQVEVEDFVTKVPENWSVDESTDLTAEAMIYAPEGKRNYRLQYTAEQKQSFHETEDLRSLECKLRAEWWHMLNSVPPMDRHYLLDAVPDADPSQRLVTFWPVGSKTYLQCGADEARDLILMLRGRGDRVSYWRRSGKTIPLPLGVADGYGVWQLDSFWMDWSQSTQSRRLKFESELQNLRERKIDLLRYYWTR